jgi:cytochrome o ubiquinol oxidase subunit 2
MIKPISNLVSRLPVKALLRNLSVVLLVILSLALSGCNSEGILAPKGQIAFAEHKLIFFSIALMLIVVIPTIFMALWFGWRYREKTQNNAKYDPEWTHSTLLEVVWWGIPCIIILILGTVTWKTTHSLDPFKPLDSKEKPVVIEVVSLDWKWLFVYPEYKIATVNYLRIPTGRPINFKITAAAPMNSFIIPQLGGQIYAMTGMTTQLHLHTDIPGSYRGFGANYTGLGFADMQFVAQATSPEDFTLWVKTVQNKPDILTADVFWNKLVPQSTQDPVQYFGNVTPGLFDDIVMSYMMPGMRPNVAPDEHAVMNQSNH